jgi:hypothetical protein
MSELVAGRFEFLVEIHGPRPPYGRVAEQLWGTGVDFDSDGNSASAEDPNWTELTVIRRPEHIDRVDVDPVSESPLVLRVSSPSRDLALLVATFLADEAEGRLLNPPATA